MSEEHIAIVDLADELRVRKQRTFKLLGRLNIRPIQRREPSGATRTSQRSACRRQPQSGEELAKSADLAGGALQATGGVVPVSFSHDIGFFYVLQLEPDHDSGRFKVGFTTELDGRLQKHRCPAPFAKYVRNWPCRRVWERTAIDSVTDGCEQLHTEVFRTTLVDTVTGRADTFFSLMPRLVSANLEAEDEPLKEAPANQALNLRGADAPTG